eukprot:TRINITY_DN4328_c5_g1_i1.p1 TRINITY_DN4328_c5_g1~~TRINITY_DN4328_c5_g1_i1.p1  ORF type:complete len:153 (+),score=8.60 TRINITY_DN4328_c5_g1_i1:198-656(+)
MYWQGDGGGPSPFIIKKYFLYFMMNRNTCLWLPVKKRKEEVHTLHKIKEFLSGSLPPFFFDKLFYKVLTVLSHHTLHRSYIFEMENIFDAEPESASRVHSFLFFFFSSTLLFDSYYYGRRGGKKKKKTVRSMKGYRKYKLLTLTLKLGDMLQ